MLQRVSRPTRGLLALSAHGAVRVSQNPVHGAVLQRELSFLLRQVQKVTRNASADRMRIFENSANSNPSDAGSQWFYLLALNENGMHAETIRRFESGRFAINELIIDAYVTAVSHIRRLGDADERDLKQRLTAALQQAGSNNPSAVLRLAAAPAAGGTQMGFSASTPGAPQQLFISSHSRPVVVELLPTKAPFWQAALKVASYIGFA
jgi:hypothetical protein